MASQLQLNLNKMNLEYQRCLAYSSSIINHIEYEDPLPYIPLEYIESTGTQYINTGYKPNGNSQYELEITNSAVNGVLFGAYNSSWTDGSGLYTNVGSKQNHWRHYASNTDTGHKSVASEHIIMNKGVLTINDNTYMNSSTASFTVNYPLWIFAGNMKGKVEQPVQCRLYYFIISENDVLLHHFVPVIRKLDNVVCLYDLVTEQFFTNIGSGSFIAGYKEELSPTPSYAHLEYIKTTGTQYLDLGVPLWSYSDWKVVTKVSFSKMYNYQHLLSISDTDTFHETWVAEDSNYYVRLKDGMKTAIQSLSVNTTYTLTNEFSSGICKTYVNGSLKNTTNFGTFTSNNNLRFGHRDSGWFIGNIYAIQLYKNGELIRDFVPARNNETNVIGMLDTVNNIFITNAGNGVFTAGGVV